MLMVSNSLNVMNGRKWCKVISNLQASKYSYRLTTPTHRRKLMNHLRNYYPFRLLSSNVHKKSLVSIFTTPWMLNLGKLKIVHQRDIHQNQMFVDFCHNSNLGNSSSYSCS